MAETTGAGPPALERFREFLRLLARIQLDQRLRGKLDASDLVQQAMLRAHQGLDGFRGAGEAELAAWLRQVLATTVADEVRRYGRGKRDVAAERMLLASRVRGHDDYETLDPDADLFRNAAPWTEANFRAWCLDLTDQEARSFPRNPAVSNSGMNWLEGNMTWTRYNHLLPPGSKSCANGLTWDGVAMTANSRHGRSVGLLLGDGSVRPVAYSVDPGVWRALGTIAGGEPIAGDSF
jgi:hypothetical protein